MPNGIDHPTAEEDERIFKKRVLMRIKKNLRNDYKDYSDRQIEKKARKLWKKYVELPD